MRRLVLVLFLLLPLPFTSCASRHERPRDPTEVAPVETRESTLLRPSVPGGSSAPGLGTTEPDR